MMSSLTSVRAAAASNALVVSMPETSRAVPRHLRSKPVVEVSVTCTVITALNTGVEINLVEIEVGKHANSSLIDTVPADFYLGCGMQRTGRRIYAQPLGCQSDLGVRRGLVHHFNGVFQVQLKNVATS